MNIDMQLNKETKSNHQKDAKEIFHVWKEYFVSWSFDGILSNINENKIISHDAIIDMMSNIFSQAKEMHYS